MSHMPGTPTLAGAHTATTMTDVPHELATESPTPSSDHTIASLSAHATSSARAPAASNTTGEPLADTSSALPHHATAIGPQLLPSRASEPDDLLMDSPASSNPTKSRASEALLANSSSSTSPQSASSSSASRPMSGVQEYELLAGSSSTDPAAPIVDPSTLVPNRTFQHLANSPSPAVVAPAGPTSSASISAGPAPTTTNRAASASASLSLHEDPRLLTHGREHQHSHASKSHAAQPSSGRSSSAAVVSANALFAAAFSGPGTSSASSSASSSSSSIVTKCQCLVVDVVRLQEGSSELREYRMVMDSAGDRLIMEGYVKQLLREVKEGDIAIAHVPFAPQDAKKLHVNFTSEKALNRALAKCPFLVRCGSLGTVSSWNTAPCGLARHECPEMISFSVNTTTPGNPTQLTDEVTKLLKEMNVEYTSMWFTSATVHGGGVNPNRRGWSVLARHVEELPKLVSLLHNKHTLWGGKVRVHAPNSPTLLRCVQCDQLGHHVNKCTIYNGLAVRLPFKETVSWHAAKQMVAKAGARAGYLGATMDEVKPSRRVTLLFDVADPASGVAAAIERVKLVVAEVADKLHANPYVVDVKDRQRECRECGDTSSSHECPFSNFKIKSVSHATSDGSSRVVPRPNAEVCQLFQKNRCPRGGKCPYKHEALAKTPATQQQVPAPPTSSAGAPVQAAAVVASAPVPVPVLAQAAVTVTAPVSAAAAPSADVVAPQASSKKKRGRTVAAEQVGTEEETKESDASTPSSAKKVKAAAASMKETTRSSVSKGSRFAALDDKMDVDEEQQPPAAAPSTPTRTTSTWSSTFGPRSPAKTGAQRSSAAAASSL